MRTAVFLLIAAFACSAENWPQWRGPDNNGVSSEKGLPTQWSEGQNIAWKLPLPAWSGSTPIVWGDRIFLTMAENGNLSLWSVDRKGPAVLWKKMLSAGDVKMRKQNMSSPSPVTDGKTVWALTGTGVLKAFDYAGKELWSRDIQQEYGKFGLNWGYASSPLLHGDALYVQVLHGMKTDDPSFVLRIEPRTGKTVWKVERPTAAISESPDSYTTPLMVQVNGKEELVISGADVLTGHDPATGRELWRAGGFNPQNNPFYRVVASPVFYDGIIYAPTRVRPLQAYRPGGRGDVTQSHRVFQFNEGPDVPTPVSDGKYLYSINDRGIAYCLDAKTGAAVYSGERLKPGAYSASPVLADGKIYITNEDGLTTVLAAGPKFQILAENNSAEYTLSSIAISEGQLFLRTDKHLYAIGQRKGK
ncbi:MAG: PQQ-binding-like beta-propeller repeat protein [Bryobacteraceae bacterium]|nr:PQQ-binding-like beta-propeller repeat protein [Bryobacteraceae bacterium]